ncbi:MAG: gfo/Idh/MocA family oxidoreductase, partial [Candidatus Sulfotelmatobacter sp.]
MTAGKKTGAKKTGAKKTGAKKTGFAIVGLGSIAQSSVLPAFANCKQAKLIALVGRDRKKASQLA